MSSAARAYSPRKVATRTFFIDDVHLEGNFTPLHDKGFVGGGGITEFFRLWQMTGGYDVKAGTVKQMQKMSVFFSKNSKLPQFFLCVC